MTFRSKSKFKLIKAHNKKRYKGKRFYFIDCYFLLQIICKIENVSKKTKKSIFKKLTRRRLAVNYRFLYLYFLERYPYLSKLYDPLRYVFYRYVFSVFVSLEYYQLTDYQLELIRRLAKKIFGKRVYIKFYISASFILLRRASQLRMGSGKGSKFFKRIYFVYPGCRIFEVRGTTQKKSKYFLKQVSKKFSIKFNVLFINRV
jgi:ribosomal protein L16/L10AE